MPTSTIVYQGNLRTEAIHLNSGNSLITDAPLDNNGKGEAFSPTDLVATAFGSCMLTMMGISANAHQIDMSETKVRITKTMAANPRRISQIEVELFMPSKDYTDKERKILEKAAQLCPVANSLHPDLKQVVSIHW